MARIEKRPTAEFSSYYGCYIIGMAGFLFAGMIAWAAWTFYSQDRAISLFTQDDKADLAVPPADPAKEADLLARLTAFGGAAKAGQPAELKLSIQELNAIIRLAPDTGYGSYREIVRVSKTSPADNCLIADLSMPLKKAKFWEGKFRYLVGEGTFRIVIHEEGLDAKLIDVRAPGKSLPSGFVGNLEVWPWIAPYRKQEPVGSMLKGIKKATVTAEGLTLSTTK
ncbi:MAG: hypothetical protein K1X78_04320 [Verrucomicrobiaceae bacterium]|nr:hypothetical protein [Verrucomicrobiaceae bacterium]